MDSSVKKICGFNLHYRLKSHPVVIGPFYINSIGNTMSLLSRISEQKRHMGRRELRRNDRRQEDRPLRIRWVWQRCSRVQEFCYLPMASRKEMQGGTLKREDDTTLETQKLRQQIVHGTKMLKKNSTDHLHVKNR